MFLKIVIFSLGLVQIGKAQTYTRKKAFVEEGSTCCFCLVCKPENSPVPSLCACGHWQEVWQWGQNEGVAAHICSLVSSVLKWKLIILKARQIKGAAGRGGLHHHTPRWFLFLSAQEYRESHIFELEFIENIAVNSKQVGTFTIINYCKMRSQLSFSFPPISRWQLLTATYLCRRVYWLKNLNNHHL